jgi:tRNA-(ms[2]io[6]A)-hydroxylase
MLQATPGDAEQGPPRPSWQWVVFGALGIVVVLLPLSWLAALAARRMRDLAGAAPVLSAAATIAPFVAALAVAALAGGYLVGRWGTAGIGVREAALAGLVAALLASAAACSGTGALAGALVGGAVTAIVAVPVAAAGGLWGLRRRR